MDESMRVEYRLRNIGFVFQFLNLFMELTVLENESKNKSPAFRAAAD